MAKQIIYNEEDILTWKIMEELPKLLGGEENRALA